MKKDIRFKLNSSFQTAIIDKRLALIICVSVLLRLVAAFLMGNTVVDLPGIYDQISYHNLAIRVLGGHGYTFGDFWWPFTPAGEATAHWSYPYTLYLVTVYAVFGVHPLFARILQAIIIGILHPYIIFRIGDKIFGRSAGLFAAAITSLYVYYIYYNTALMTESFYITAILFSLFYAIQLMEKQGEKKYYKLGLCLGVSIGIAVVLRQVFLLFVPFLFLLIWIGHFRHNRTLPVFSTVLSIFLISLFILPITLYNYSRFNRLVLLNTNSGYAFFWGNHPIYGTRFIPILPSGTYQDLIPPELRNLDEAALDQELLKRGIQFVIDDPQRYVLLSLSRIPPYFMFWYSPESTILSNISRVASFGFFLPIILYGMYLGVKMRASAGRVFVDFDFTPQGLLILFILVYSLIHILTWTLIRYRLPVDAVLISFAGLALFDITQRLSVKYPFFNHILKIIQ